MKTSTIASIKAQKGAHACPAHLGEPSRTWFAHSAFQAATGNPKSKQKRRLRARGPLLQTPDYTIGLETNRIQSPSVSLLHRASFLTSAAR
ncbi:hypothetical protein, partial [Achromobacter sp.]|uniref:hypothetical protein n=1 Tax=Achromobacter sp. TaxID=134375 RepID=UPI002F931A5A